MNLNEIITDEDEEVQDDLPEIESDDIKIFKDNDLYKNVNQLFSSLESIKNKIEIYDYIVNKSNINKKLATEVNSIFKNTIAVESYTAEDSKVNYKETVVFMKDDIDSQRDASIEILKDIFSKGLDQCDELYEHYVNVIRPILDESYNEIYLSISDNIDEIDLNSILFYNTETKEFVNISPMPLKEIINNSLVLDDIPDDTKEIHFKDILDIVKCFNDLFESNKSILKAIISISNADKPLSMDELYNSVLMDNDILLKDIFNFYTSSKGHFYINNAQSLLDYINNLVSFKKSDYETIKNDTNSIAAYSLSVQEEVGVIKNALEFMQDFLNGLSSFIEYSKKLFTVIKVLKD
jgi:hypothetical protein